MSSQGSPSPRSEDSGSTDIDEILENEPMYYVLGQFLETAEGKNVAVCLEALTAELRALRKSVIPLLQAFAGVQQKPSRH